MSACHMCTGACGGQKAALDPLKLESQVVASHQKPGVLWKNSSCS